MKQNPNQKVEYTSGFLEEEEVNESDFDEPVEAQKKDDKLADTQSNKLAEDEHPKKTKRPRKTIEQEIAELDAKRERLIDKKRKNDTRVKIVFGSIIIGLLKDMRSKGLVKEVSNILRMLEGYTHVNYKKEIDLIEKISLEINSVEVIKDTLKK